MVRKLFENVKEGDEVYFLDPNTFEIKSIKIKTTTQAIIGQGFVDLEYWLLEPPKLEVDSSKYPEIKGQRIKDNFLFEGTNLDDLGLSKVLRFQKKAEAVVVSTNPPTVYATSKEFIELWMQGKVSI
jgi:hypothetical protein